LCMPALVLIAKAWPGKVLLLFGSAHDGG
jgi:hypothetical protein